MIYIYICLFLSLSEVESALLRQLKLKSTKMAVYKTVLRYVVLCVYVCFTHEESGENEKTEREK